jgi:hypothetical protein
MTEYKTLRVPVDAYEQAQAARQEHDDTWGEYLRRCAENPPEKRELVDGAKVEDALEEQHKQLLNEIEGRLR